jgi:MFS family permease
MASAFCQSTNLFIATRMLTGLAVASNVLNPAIIGDMFESDKRGSAMSLIMLAPLIGGAVGPAISGAIAQTFGWRQVLVIASGCALLCEVLFLTCFRETYKMAILRRRVHRIQQESGEFDHVTVTSTHENLLKLWHAITRPFAVLFGSAVLMLIALFAAISFSYFYVMCISLPEISQNLYNFTPAQAGSTLLAFSKSSCDMRL